MSAHLVAAASRGRLKECNQTRSLWFFYGAGYLLIFNSETNPTAPKCFWSLTFRESVRNQLPTRERAKRLSAKLQKAGLSNFSFPI